MIKIADMPTRMVGKNTNISNSATAATYNCDTGSSARLYIYACKQSYSYARGANCIHIVRTCRAYMSVERKKIDAE